MRYADDATVGELNEAVVKIIDFGRNFNAVTAMYAVLALRDARLVEESDEAELWQLPDGSYVNAIFETDDAKAEFVDCYYFWSTSDIGFDNTPLPWYAFENPQ